MKRLQDLYLYSERAMTEKDFIIQKNEISSRIQDINTRLGMVTHDANSTLSDEDFVRASKPSPHYEKTHWSGLYLL